MTSHTKRTALETTLGDIASAITDIAESVNAPVPSEARCPRCGELRGMEPPDGCRDYFCPIALLEDDEDAESDDPPLFDAPLTDRQEAAAYHIEEWENEGWINDPDEDEE